MRFTKKYILFLSVLLFSLSSQAQTVFKTPSGAKYHLATCRMVKNVSKEITTNRARELGLQPCSICSPQNINGLSSGTFHKAKGESKTVQCKGLTKAGTRCKHKTSIANGYCYQHQ